MDESTGIWEWDSVLETCSSLLDHDHMGQADSFLLEHILNGSSAEGNLTLLEGHGQGRVDSLASLPFSEQQSANSTVPSSGRQRKRDLRLLCPNFQAGFVPCSCPEVDEMDDDETSQKRVKAAVHCQVPGCRSDITELKGYHRRHKVCLECANSSQVVVNDQIQRYCQQCGKFHPLSDFDEGKRSCRRKLERHNNRRRRKPMGESQGKETFLMECENGSMPFQLEGDGELCAQTSVTEFSGEKEKRSTPSKSLPKTGGNVSDNLHTTKADAIRASEESSAARSQIGKDDAHSSKSEADEQFPCMQLMNENVESEGLPSNLSLPRHLEGSESAMLRSSLSSSLQRNRPTYSSPCPTSHLSFKFFAWNPADFPRRLREQIFEWLAKMPAELDAYIRGGCTLVTFFIAMSQPTWDEFDSNWECYLRSLLSGCHQELWGAGNVVVRMNSRCLLLENGKILENFEEESTPHLHTAYPLCLEAGESSEILVYGQNISKQNAKVLVAFRDGYLDCRNLSDYDDDDALLLSETHASPSGNGHQVLKVLVVASSHQQFGPAYVEVDNRLGTGNFIPLLVADKEVCAEVNSLSSSQDFAQRMCCVNACGTGMGRPEVFEILLDLGHVLRHLEIESDNVGKEEALLWRLQKLLPFSIERGWFAVSERLFRVANSTGLVSKLGISSESLNSFQLTMPLLQKHSTIGPTMIWNKSGLQNATVCFSSRNPESGHSWKNHNPSTDQRTPSEKLVSLAEDDLRIAMPDDTVSWEGGEKKYASLLRHKSLSWVTMRSKRSLDSIWSNDYFRSGRITRRIVLTTASVVTVCVGICFVSQHPHRIAEISMSLKHCLWGPIDSSPML